MIIIWCRAYVGERHTWLRVPEKGKPLSRANDQIMRDAVARNPMVVLKARATRMADMPVLPPTEPVACMKISIKGKPMVFWAASASSGLPMQKMTAISIPKPREPLMMMLRMMDRGTSTAALAISSDIYRGLAHKRLIKQGYENTYMNSSIGTDKRKGCAKRAHHEGQAVCWPITLI